MIDKVWQVWQYRSIKDRNGNTDTYSARLVLETISEDRASEKFVGLCDFMGLDYQTVNQETKNAWKISFRESIGVVMHSAKKHTKY